MNKNTVSETAAQVRRYLILLLFFVLPFGAYAQFLYRAQPFHRYLHYKEMGIMLGATNYSGDIAERDIEINQTKLGFGFFFRYHITQKLHVKAQFYSGAISGDDANSPTLNVRKFRFYGRINELTAIGEWVPLALEHVTITGIHNYYVSPFVFFGVGVAHSKPEAEYYGPASNRNLYLRTPLPENNIENRYFLSTPIGAGVRIDHSERLTFSVEGGWRPVYHDSLDGIKINGNPKKGDWYYFMGITASYYFNEPWRPF
ncbi:MAG: hypothetical protein KGS48_14335 [Bacteroidetes bacterium]|nr:hypothetical protein [Bacteroidota bacterium]